MRVTRTARTSGATVYAAVRILALAALSLITVSAALAAEAPQWAKGFPRLADKNVLLQWDPMKGAAEYKVYRTETKGKDLKLLDTVKVNRHIDKDAPSGKTFFYYVTAMVEGKEGPRSEAASVSTPKEKVFVPLKAPQLAGVHYKATGAKPSAALRWEGGAGSELVGYNVYRSTKKGSGYTLIGSTAADTYADEDVKPGVTYYYVVTSVDSNFNETKHSNEAALEVPKAKEEEKPVKKEEVPPTKLRAAKLLFTIPPRDMAEDEKKRFMVPTSAIDVAVDEAVGHIYVTSYEYGGILVYDMQGRFQFGMRQDGINGEKKFAAASHLALGPNGNVYMTDYTSPDIYIFDFAGKLVDTINVDISHVPGMERVKARLLGIEVSPEGIVYVTDPVSNRIYGYDIASKKRVLEITENKKKKVEFGGPSFMTLDSDGDLVFVDVNYSVMRVFGTDGTYKRSMGVGGGLGAGHLYFPTGVARGNDKEIFIGSGKSPNIQAFSTDGNFMYLLGNEGFDAPPDLKTMRGMYVDSRNRIYVADGLADRVVVFQMLDKYQEVVPEK